MTMSEELVRSEQPKLYQHCTRLYVFMDENSQPGLSDSDVPDDSVRVWRGRLLEACESIDIPRGGTTRVLATLRKMGCIEQTARGFRGTALTEYILHYPPTPEAWAANVNSRGWGLTRGPSPDKIAADVRDLQTQLGGINLVSALKNLDDRLSKIETQLGATSKIEPQDDSVTNKVQ